MAEEKLGQLPIIEDQPIYLAILAVLPRPKAMTGLNRDGKPKYDPGLVWHLKRPDKDNIEKGVMDALAPFWRDDSIIVSGPVIKCYAEERGRGRVVVRIRTETRTPREAAVQAGLLE